MAAPPPGDPFGPDALDAIVEAAIRCELAGSERRALLIPDPTRRAHLGAHTKPADQLRADLTALATDAGARPWLADWLTRAARIVGDRPEAADFDRWAALAGRPTAPIEVLHRPAEPTAAPTRPYPVLLGPYTDRRLFAGRAADVADLCAHLARHPLVCVFAASGAGKSSLLRAGLAPALRDARTPEALVRAPHNPDAPAELLRQLASPAPPADTPAAFVAGLEAIHRLAGPPVLVLDQFEELFKGDRQIDARARLGPYLAASARTGPDGATPLCRWVLAYRREFHGDVEGWLADVLREARDAGRAVEGWPYDIKAGGRSVGWKLPPFGEAPRGTHDPDAAYRAFLDAITKPLAHATDGIDGMRWQMASDDADRLAGAFAAARAAQPDRPLVPELQVVLARLLDGAVDGVIAVPADVEQSIGHALRDHVERSIKAVVPAGRAPVATARALVLTALHRLVDDEGRRSRSLPRGELEAVIAADGEPARAGATIDKLIDARLVVAEVDPDRGECLALSHDRLAEVIAELVEARPGSTFDPALLDLVGFIQRRVVLWRHGDPAAVGRDDTRFDRLAATAGLLWDDDRRGWWEAWGAETRRRRAAEVRQRRWRRAGVGALIGIFVVGAFIWLWLQAEAHRSGYDRALASPQEETVLTALGLLTASGLAGDDAVGRLPTEPKADIWTLMSETFVGLDPPIDTDLRLALAHHWRGRVDAGDEPPDRGEQVERFGRLLAAVDIARLQGADPARVTRARAAVVEALRVRFPLPDGLDDAALTGAWVALPGGRFEMGSPENEAGRDNDETRYPVTLSPFRLGEAEVTAGQLRRLLPDHRPGDADPLPARGVSWYTATAYAAWVGARLPTEAEWEYAARWRGEGAPLAKTRYCAGDGEADLDRVGWYDGNSGDDAHPIKGKEPCGGLYDLHGNVWEWVADRYGAYPDDAGAPRADPAGPPTGDARVVRGGSFDDPADFARAAVRYGWRPWNRSHGFGFRLARPAPSPVMDLR